MTKGIAPACIDGCRRSIRAAAPMVESDIPISSARLAADESRGEYQPPQGLDDFDGDGDADTAHLPALLGECGSC
ncbi:MAG: hypothetical protein SYC29_07425 [Planctomycetota bacterium]|nr:hypothetical protein [Planctomycetota bacterium]